MLSSAFLNRAKCSIDGKVAATCMHLPQSFDVPSAEVYTRLSAKLEMRLVTVFGCMRKTLRTPQLPPRDGVEVNGAGCDCGCRRHGFDYGYGFDACAGYRPRPLPGRSNTHHSQEH